MAMTETEMQELVAQVNRAGGIYHKIELGHGYTLDGEYDMTKYLSYYGFPKDLTGWSVLDIGTASGFFAFEFAKRHGLVTAIDIWDGGLFQQIGQALDSTAIYKQKNIYDLDESFGSFDLVFCGSLLLHLSDLFEAIRRIHSVCKREAIIATVILSDPKCDHIPCCQFIGARAIEADYWVTWLPNIKALQHMCIAAGFSKTEKVSEFYLNSEPGKNNFSTLHGVIRACV